MTAPSFLVLRTYLAKPVDERLTCDAMDGVAGPAAQISLLLASTDIAIPNRCPMKCATNHIIDVVMVPISGVLGLPSYQ